MSSSRISFVLMTLKILGILILLGLVFTKAHAQAVDTEAEQVLATDFDAPPRAALEILPGLYLGARLEIEYQLEKDFDLDVSDEDNISEWQPRLSTALRYEPTENVTVFTNLDLSRSIVHDDEGDDADLTSLALGETWLSISDLVWNGVLRLGRQRLNDKREWIYDDELDGVRIWYPFSRYLLDVSVTERHDGDLLLHNDEDRVTNYMVHARYLPDEDTEYGIYVLAQNDRKVTQEDPVFFGLHAHGEALDDLEYWTELAHARGNSGRNKIRGVGFDVGATYEFDLPYEPSVTLAYAFGSGDNNPDDGTDGNFRQTGLQDNEAKFNGVIRFKYYGEMLDPELSNLGVATAGLGFRPIHDASFNVIYHYYRQVDASSTVRNAEVDEDPDGRESELGHEIDFVAGYRLRPHQKGSLIVGYFMPGEAFPRHDDDALFVEIQFRYEF